MIDGQALGPEHFAQINEDGDYKPIPYAGTYGNNGYHLAFEASHIGKDLSGNGNDFEEQGLTPDSVFADNPCNLSS